METKHERVFERRLWGGPARGGPAWPMPPRRTLAGSLVQLEPLNPEAHSAAFYRASHHGPEALKIWDYLYFGPWSSEGEFESWFSDCAESQDFIWHAVRLKASGEVLGMACYMDLQSAHGAIEMGILLTPEFQRTRASTETLFLMLDHAMSDLGYRRMLWRCESLNRRSRDAALRLGFKFEGISYNHMIVKGKNRDTACYSLLDIDWPPAREIIVAWLDDENFDADGTARSSLSERMGKRVIRERE